MLSQSFDLIQFIVVSFFMLFSIRIAFLINNLYDIAEDKLHPLGETKNPFTCCNEDELKWAKIITFLLAFTFIVLFYVIYRDPLTSLLYAFLISLDVSYSAPPRLKERPPFDIISHSFYFGSLLIALPLSIFGVNVSFNILKLLVGVSFLSMSMELGNHISDYEFDMEAGVKTFATKYGPKTSKYTFYLTYLTGTLTLTNLLIENFVILIIFLFLLVILVSKTNLATLNKSCSLITNMIFFILIVKEMLR